MSDQDDPFETFADISLDKLASPQIEVRDGCIVLDGDYAIPLVRCDTAAKVLGWIDHLDGHMNGRFTGLIRHFVRVAARENNIEIERSV